MYRIIRMYQDGRPSRTIRKVKTLKEAQDHCNDPSTSSGAGTGKPLIEGDKVINWFDGYTEI